MLLANPSPTIPAWLKEPFAAWVGVGVWFRGMLGWVGEVQVGLVSLLRSLCSPRRAVPLRTKESTQGSSAPVCVERRLWWRR